MNLNALQEQLDATDVHNKIEQSKFVTTFNLIVY